MRVCVCPVMVGGVETGSGDYRRTTPHFTHPHTQVSHLDSNILPSTLLCTAHTSLSFSTVCFVHLNPVKGPLPIILYTRWTSLHQRLR